MANTGNVRDPDGSSTGCPGCGGRLIGRDGYEPNRRQLKKNYCVHCGFEIAGRFADQPGHWGTRRLSVQLS